MERALRGRPRPGSLLATLVAMLLLSSSAHAQIASYVRTILPVWGSEKIEKTADGHFTVTRSDGVSEYDAAWNLIRHYDVYGVISGGVKLPNGTLVVRDLGQTTTGHETSPRIMTLDAAGSPQTIVNLPPCLARASTPEVADDGSFFLASNPTTTGAVITRYSAGLAASTTWSQSTGGWAIAVKSGVVYLAGDASGKIWKYGLDGSLYQTIQTVLGGPAWAIDVDDEGRMYVLTAPSAGSLGGYLSILAPSGSRLQSIERPQPGDAPFAYPRDVLVKGKSLYVSDQDKVYEYALQSAVPVSAATWGRMKAQYR